MHCTGDYMRNDNGLCIFYEVILFNDNWRFMNLSNLPEDEQFRIELEREAAFLIWRYNRFEIKRPQINEAIQSKPVEYQQYFKDALNKFTEINKKALQ